MATYTPNYNLEKPEASDPFGDFRESYNDNLDIIDAYLGGGGSGGHTIYDENGSAMTQRTGLEFTGNVSVSDDGVNDKTVVDILGGSNLILDAQIYSTEEKQVGVWTDKKPLYQKTIVLNSEITVSNNDWTSTGVTANSLDVETYVRCVAQNSGGTCWDAVNVATIGGYIALTAWRNGDTIGVKEFTIQYTKTTDTAGSGGYQAYGFTPVIYSDVERVIGVWRDNKPLYAKVISLGGSVNVNAYSWYVYGTLAEQINIVDAKGYNDVGSEMVLFLLGANCDTNNDLSFLNYRNSSVTLTHIAIQYTKTSDVAGSGDYNTYGVPTVHYDTNEQVVGTWIDGKPLYQKTVEIGTVNAGQTRTVAHGISNFKRLVDFHCEGYNTAENAWNVIPKVDNEASYQRSVKIDTVNIVIGNSPNAQQLTDTIATIQYTKTTD